MGSRPSYTPMAPQEDRTVGFSNVEDLLKEISALAGDVLIVEGITIGDVEDLVKDRDNGGEGGFLIRRFEASKNLLVIIVPSAGHDRGGRILANAVRDQIVAMGLDSSWTDDGTGKRRGKPSTGHGDDGGEPDACGGPDPARLGADAWPTLIVETGLSQSLDSLHDDMRWWFSASDHDVKTVLLIKIYPGSETILIEHWQEVHPNPTWGAMTTRSAARLEPQLQRSIEITRDRSTNPITHRIVGTPLMLSFRLLFLRDPGPRERDVRIDAPLFEQLARRVWAALQV